MKKALQIVDRLIDRYREDLQAAIQAEDKAKIAHWQAFQSALTMVALEIEEAMKK